MINGLEEDSYVAFPEYCKDLEYNNPESTIILECIDEGTIYHFKCIFMCYGMSLIGFAFYCLVFNLDGTHLKPGKYRGYKITLLVTNKGVLLAAMVSNANRSLFPLAYIILLLWLKMMTTGIGLIRIFISLLSNMLHHSLFHEHLPSLAINKKASILNLVLHMTFLILHRAIVFVIFMKTYTKNSSIQP